MKRLIPLLQAEYLKSKRTLAFRGAIILPIIICTLIYLIFFLKSNDFLKLNTPNLWLQLLSIELSIMGTLILPMYLIFLTYSINYLEHKADTWKNLFSLPISGRMIFFSKYIFTILVFVIFIITFFLGTISVGYLLGITNPELKFQNYNLELTILSIFIKLGIGSLFLLSFQFLLSILWSDFMKSMGMGLALTIVSIILYQWDYSYLLPHSQPMHAVNNLFGKNSNFSVDFFTKDIIAGSIGSVVVVIISYILMKKKSIK